MPSSAGPQAADRWPTGMGLAVFDIDGTLVTGPSTERRLFLALLQAGFLGHGQLLAFGAFAVRHMPAFGRQVFRKNKAYLAGLPAARVTDFVTSWAPPALARSWFGPAVARLREHRQRGDRVVLLVTFALTVAFDLTLAIEVGVVLAAFVFMHRMSTSVSVAAVEEGDAEEEPDARQRLPEGVEMFRFSGPLFFAVANRLDQVLDPIREPPRIFILRLRQVPLIDASGVTALEEFVNRCQKMGTAVILSGLHGQPHAILHQMDFGKHPNLLGLAEGFEEALAMARAALKIEAQPA